MHFWDETDGILSCPYKDNKRSYDWINVSVKREYYSDMMFTEQFCVNTPFMQYWCNHKHALVRPKAFNLLRITATKLILFYWRRKMLLISFCFCSFLCIKFAIYSLCFFTIVNLAYWQQVDRVWGNNLNQNFLLMMVDKITPSFGNCTAE